MKFSTTKPSSCRLCYAYGTGGTSVHPALARRWFRAAAAKGDVTAAFCMGSCWLASFEREREGGERDINTRTRTRVG